MVNDKIDKFIAGVAKIESWVRLVRVACLSFLEIVRCPMMLRFVRLMQLAVSVQCGESTNTILYITRFAYGALRRL